MLRAYIRVSTDTQNLVFQRERIEEISGTGSIKYYEDVGSGKTLSRNGLSQLICDLQPYDIVIVTHLDRLSRCLSDGLLLREIILTKRADLLTLDNESDILADKNLEHYAFLLRQAETEIESTSVRVSIAMRSLLKIGKLRSRPPFGWKFVGKNMDYQHVPEQQAVIEKIVDLYKNGGLLGKGLNYAQIAKQLNEDGDNFSLTLNKKKQRTTTPNFYAEQIKRILIDCELVKPKNGEERIPIGKRIITHVV